MKYVDVVIENNSDHTDCLYTYGCSFEDVAPGQKVQVPFGKGDRLKGAFVFSVRDELENPVENLKYVESLDPDICLSREMIETCRWMKKRYLCRYIEAVSCFTPPGKAPKKAAKEGNLDPEKYQREACKEPTFEQRGALSQILPGVREGRHDIFLLHGVTGSGKTEIYLRVIEEAASAGKTAIILVPEISLTPLLIDRFMRRFDPERIAVLHSKLTPAQRFRQWLKIKRGEIQVVIGARSAVFAPLENIGVIILDEEHEGSYKADMSPKYETSEVAIKRAMAWGSTVILGSATPSINSMYRAEQGFYKYIQLKNRYNMNPLPEVEIVDMRQELKEGNRSVISGRLYQAMKETLEQGQQVIVLLNRRGYTTFVSCRDCGYVVKCQGCGISMTYHKDQNACVCHYCGRKVAVPEVCPKCGSRHIKHFGAGTEKLEEGIRELFEGYKTDRLDIDTVKTKGSMERILSDFERGDTRILIGTQLVAKGLDFRNVGLVGIVSADISLNIPDFRSAERTFQLVTQASGRAGRGDEQGHVVIQAYSPEHFSIAYAAESDYRGFYEEEIALRRLMDYPPFTDLVQLVAVAKTEKGAQQAGSMIYQEVKKRLGNLPGVSIYPPNRVLANSIKEHFRYGVLVKCPREQKGTCLAVAEAMKKFINTGKNQRFTLLVDINPY